MNRPSSSPSPASSGERLFLLGHSPEPRTPGGSGRAVFVSLWEKAASASFCLRGSLAQEVRGACWLPSHAEASTDSSPKCSWGRLSMGTRPRAVRPCVHQRHGLRAWGPASLPSGSQEVAPGLRRHGPGATQQHAACSPQPLWSALQPEAPAHTLTQLRFYFRPSLMLSTVQQI